MATIKDVAKLSGVSATTVSIIVNGKSEERRISPETKERVMEAMKKLSYQPNLSARKLRFQNSFKPTIAFFWPLDYRTPILASLLNSFQKEIKAQNLNCEFIIQSYENDALELDASAIIDNSYNAVIIGALSHKDLEYLESLKPNMPVVLVNRQSELFSSVYTDHMKIGFQAANLFKDKGYREVTVVSTNDNYMATELRTQAFSHACSQLGITISPNSFKGHSTITDGAQVAEEICRLSEIPKVLFFESDSMAMGALHTFDKFHIRIPEDIEILSIGMLNSESTSLCIPSLSVIEMPYSKMSSLIIQIIKDKLTNNDLSPIHHKLDAKLVLRKSFTI